MQRSVNVGKWEGDSGSKLQVVVQLQMILPGTTAPTTTTNPPGPSTTHAHPCLRWRHSSAAPGALLHTVLRWDPAGAGVGAPVEVSILCRHCPAQGLLLCSVGCCTGCGTALSGGAVGIRGLARPPPPCRLLHLCLGGGGGGGGEAGGRSREE